MVGSILFLYNRPMIVDRLAGGCLAAISFILFGLVMSTRGSSNLGIQIMDRLGLPFVLGFLAVQVVIGMVFLGWKELKVPLLLFTGGSILFLVLGKVGGQGAVPLQHALFAGASFSGLALGVLTMMGEGRGET